jgi:hypothetical protein
MKVIQKEKNGILYKKINYKNEGIIFI